MEVNKIIYNNFLTNRQQDNKTVNNDSYIGMDRRKIPRIQVNNINPVKQYFNAVQHYDQMTKREVVKKAETACRYVPPLRKALSSFEEGKSGDWIYSTLMVYRLINESKEDWADIKEAIKGGEDPYVDYQHPFWATKESLIDEKFRNNKCVRFLAKHDYTLFDLKPIKKALVKIGMTSWEHQNDLIKIHGNWYSQVFGRAALRIPIQGMALFMLMNTYSICKAENKPKEFLKSIIRIACIMGLSALCGSLGKPSGKPVELALMGAGIIWGVQLANKINDKF